MHHQSRLLEDFVNLSVSDPNQSIVHLLVALIDRFEGELEQLQDLTLAKNVLTKDHRLLNTVLHEPRLEEFNSAFYANAFFGQQKAAQQGVGASEMDLDEACLGFQREASEFVAAGRKTFAELDHVSVH